MPNLDVPIATHFLTGSILSLVVPLAALVLVAVWFVLMWRSGTGER